MKHMLLTERDICISSGSLLVTTLPVKLPLLQLNYLFWNYQWKNNIPFFIFYYSGAKSYFFLESFDSEINFYLNCASLSNPYITLQLRCIGSFRLIIKKPVFSRVFQFRRVNSGDSQEVVKPFAWTTGFSRQVIVLHWSHLQPSFIRF